ncbi:MAG: hypothetical protein JXB25_08950 [Deltaproteobacteria bacterium]|nr:hypothetical protein [Deltaproteobacteria bacterium]
MYFWRKEIEKLDIAVDKIVFLFSSMNDVQIALPGYPCQRSSAYLCAYSVPGGYESMAVLLLHDVRQLAFYCFKEVFPGEKLDDVVQEGILFVESMGFMLNDLDFRSFGPEQRREIWESIPLAKGSAGLPPPVTAAPAPAAAAPAGEGDIPMSPLLGGGSEEGGRRGYERRLEVCRKLGRLLASF